MRIESVQPEGWSTPRGYANGILVDGLARLLFVAGQIAWDSEQRLVGAGDFGAQFRQALENVVAIVRAAGGEPKHVVETTVYVTDKAHYLADQKGIGATWRDIMGRHYPAMALVEVSGLLEEGALVEIQARAALPPLPAVTD